MQSVHGVQYAAKQGVELYAHAGTSTDYVQHTYAIPSITIELRPGIDVYNSMNPLSGFYGYEDMVKGTFEENIEGLFVALTHIYTKS